MPLTCDSGDDSDSVSVGAVGEVVSTLATAVGDDGALALPTLSETV